MPAKRILLIDDHRDITRMLRAALESQGRDYIIVDVPTGEEAVLEINRGGVDLVVVDIRLPGMSGMDVIKRVRKQSDKTPIIVISGAADSATQADVQRMGLPFFLKPLRLEDFLKAAQRALGDQQEESKESTTPSAQAEPGVTDRISTLRRDLGATAVLLVDLDGKVVVRAGDVMRLNLDEALKHLMVAFGASLKLCKLLGGFIPTNVQFFDGDDWDIYSANVGQYFALVIVFDGDRGAGQMGPVMRYGRQCADDLLNSLVMLGVTDEPTSLSAPVGAPPSTAPLVSRSAPSAPPARSTPPVAAPLPSRAAPAPTPPPARASGPNFRMPDQLPPRDPLPGRAAPTPPPVAAKPAPPPPPPPEPPKPAVPEKPLTEADLKALDDAFKKVATSDASSFWDMAVEEMTEEKSGLSWEEAEKLGLMPKK